MADEIGSIKSVRGYSTELNGQSGCGGQKPAFTGRENPGNTKPPRPADGPVPMPK
jgi:hypothetical protein